MTDNWRGTINNKYWYVLVNDNGFLVFRRCVTCGTLLVTFVHLDVFNPY